MESGTAPPRPSEEAKCPSARSGVRCAVRSLAHALANAEGSGEEEVGSGSRAKEAAPGVFFEGGTRHSQSWMRVVSAVSFGACLVRKRAPMDGRWT